MVTDEWGNPIYDPNNNGTIPGCAQNDTNPACDDTGRTPGYIIPELYTVENITLITVSATDKGTFPVYMFLYETEKYDIPYTIAPIKDETERLYLETGVINPLSNAVMQTKQCWASPTEDSQHENVFLLIDDFCPTADAVDKVDMKGVFGNGQDIQNRFDSLVYQFVGSERVYIFCKVKICITSLQSCDMSDYCTSGNKRKRRSAIAGPESEISNLSYQGDMNSPAINGGRDDKVIRIGPIMPQTFAANNSRPIVMIEPEFTTQLIADVVDVVMKNVEKENNNDIAALLTNLPIWSIVLFVLGMVVMAMLLVLFIGNVARKNSGHSGNMKN